MNVVVVRRRRRHDGVPFDLQMKGAGLPPWLEEFRFHPPRQWRFDVAWPQWMIAFEREGGTWTGGRHNLAAGFERDCEKYNQAAIDGWLLIRATASMIRKGLALYDLRRAFSARGLE